MRIRLWLTLAPCTTVGPLRADTEFRFSALNGVTAGTIHYNTSASKRDPAIEKAVMKGQDGLSKGQQPFYDYAEVNLGAGKVMLVMLGGDGFAGTGGGTLEILAPRQGRLERISSTGLVHAPVLVSSHLSHGRHSLVVQTGGGGAAPAYRRLDFNGRAYPESAQDGVKLPAGTRVTGEACFSRIADKP